MFKIISSQIKMFEKLYNGVEEAVIDIAELRKVKSGFFCPVTIHEDNFSSKTVHKDVLYPLEISKLSV